MTGNLELAAAKGDLSQEPNSSNHYSMVKNQPSAKQIDKDNIVFKVRKLKTNYICL